MKIRVVSLMWGNAWERYGENFANSFAKFWPEWVELVVVADRDLKLPRGRVAQLNAIPGVNEFRNRWQNFDTANGRRAGRGIKADADGYSWRLDAVKWMPQAMAPLAVLDDMDDKDILIWLDADVVTTKQVPDTWPVELLGEADVACLQRAPKHSEIGFYSVRVGPRTRGLLQRFAGFYTEDKVFDLKEWHSAFVFDRAIEVDPYLRINNLTAAGAHGHVFPSSPLSECLVHLKGKRKDA